MSKNNNNSEAELEKKLTIKTDMLGNYFLKNKRKI
jgi:hypothetical protein